MKRTLASLSMAAAAASLGGQAYAGGFAIGTQNASGLGNAYAGAGAAAEDASTIFYNPAGLTRLGGMQAVVAGNLLKPSSKFSNSASTVPALPAGGVLGGNGGDGGDWAIVPNAYFSWQLNPRVHVGVGVNAPFGLKTEYDAGWMGRFYALKSEVKAINVNPTIAYKVSDAVSVGFGVSYQYFEAELTNAVNYVAGAVATATAACVPQPACVGPATAAAIGAVGAQTEGIGKVKGDEGAWGFNVGLMFNATPDTRIGLAYRSSINYTLSGTATFTNRPAALAAALPDGSITADIKTPASFSLSLAHQVNPRWQLLADLTWTQWSTMQALNVMRTTGALLNSLTFQWDDTWRVGLGLNYRANDIWTWRFGLAYDQSPTNDVHRSPRLPDQDRTWIAIGAQYRIGKQGAIDFGYAHEFVKDPAINAFPPNVSAATAAANGRLIGTFDSRVDILSVQYRHSF